MKTNMTPKRLRLAFIYSGVLILILIGSALFALQSIDPSSASAPLADAVEITKSVDKTVVGVEEVFTYRLQYRCASLVQNCTNVQIRDVLPNVLDANNVAMIGSVHTTGSNNNAGTVTFDFIEPLPAGSTGEVKIRVQFPNDAADGAQAVNSAEILSDQGNVTSGNVTTTVTNSSTPPTPTPTPPPTIDDIYAGKEQGNGNQFAIGQEVSYAVFARNDGDNSLDNFYFEDFLPSGLEFTGFESGSWTDNVPMSISYQTSVNGSWTAWPASFSWNADTAHTVSELSLAANEYVTALRWEFGTVPGGFSHDGNRPRINATVLPSNSVGDTITNCNTASGDGQSGTITDNRCFDISVVTPQPKPWASKSLVADNPFIVGEIITVSLRVGNHSEASADLVNPTIMDLLPTGFSYAGSWSQTDTNYPSPTFAELANHNSTGRTLLRWSWDNMTLTPGQYFDINVGIIADGSVMGWKANEYDVTADSSFDDCYGEDGFRTDTHDLDGDGDTTEQFCWENTSIQIVENAPQPVVNKWRVTSGSAVPGQAVTWEVRAENKASAPASYSNPIVMDLLPSELEFTGTWTVADNVSEAVPTPIFEQIANYDGTGRTLLRWSWTGASAYELQPGGQLRIQFETRIKDGAGGTIRNDYDLTSNVTPTDSCSGGSTHADVNDLDGDGDRAELHCSEHASVTVEEVAALESEKLVLGQLDADYSKFPVVGRTIPGGIDDYRLSINNPGNVAMTDIVIYDILPHVGDTGVIVGDNRESQWRPFLVGSVVAPAGVTVYYSLSTNPCRPEVLPAGPVGCVDDWSVILPADPTTVSSLKIDFGDVILDPADALMLEWPMRAPNDAPTNGEVAWNSFAFSSSRADNGESLLPSEPIKVGVATFDEDPAVYGDLVWLDANRDGILNNNEAGVDGLRVELYRDNGDGINDPANDTLETFTLTTNGGEYRFPNLAPGDYYAVVYLPPTYSPSPIDQGALDSADSDGTPNTFKGLSVAIMPVTTLDTNEVDLTWDQGIFQPDPPPAAVGNYVWFDDDSDGTQNEGATSGLNGITVNLYQAGNPSTPYSTMQTQNDVNGNPGYYLFDGLPAGDYFIEYILPDGSSFTPQGSTGSSDPTDSDPDPSTGRTETFTLIAGEYDDTWDAGIILETGDLTLGNRIWNDVNNDGDHDLFDGEDGINSVVVNLYEDTDGNGVYTPGVDTFRATTSTFTKAGVPGYYEFTNLPDGDYIVQIPPENFGTNKPLENLSSSTGNGIAPDPDNDVDSDDNGEPLGGHGVVSQAVTLTDNSEPTSEDGDNDSNMTVDFGFYDSRKAIGAIGNYIWIDEDSDGFQDAGERGIPGVVVTLTDGSGNVFTTTTDANGGYLFSGLLPEAYTVRVDTAQPALAELAHTGVNLPGSDFGNQDPTGYPILLGEGEENLTADFGFNYGNANGNTGLGAIGDRIWLDTDGDGAQDDSEMGIGGVLVQLVDATGAVIATTTTDATGFYIFTDLPAGAYDVVIPASNFTGGQPLENFTQTGDPDHYGTTGDNDNQTSSPIVLAPGDVFLNADFGYQPPAGSYDNSIGDTIWFDTDRDGALNGSEYGIEGVTVSLFDSNGNVIATTTTNASGEYLFPNLPDGTYTVQVTDTNNVLAGLTQSADPDATNGDPVVFDNTSTVSVSGGENNDVQDFGYAPEMTNPANTGVIGDTIWLNTDGDGTQGADEPGIEGVIVTLTLPNGTTLTTTTDENGHYYFGDLDPNGTYIVTIAPENFVAGGVLEGLENNFDPNGGNDNTSSVTLTPSNPVNLDQDFGYTPFAGQAARIGNLVWLDVNANGVLDAGEQPIGDVTIDLYRDLNGNGKLDPGEPLFGSTVTGAAIDASANGTDGNYIFEGLPAGDYIVDVTDTNNVLDGYWHSLGTAGADNNSQVDAYALSVVAGDENLTADFGYYVEPAAVGNYVWLDTSGDGIQDSVELPLPGVTITLRIEYPDGSIINLETVTDENGFYSFNNLLTDEDYNGDGSGPEPTFTIAVAPFQGYIPTTTNAAGSTNANDSNDPLGTNAQPTQGQTNVAPEQTAENASYDFGFVELEPTSVTLRALNAASAPATQLIVILMGTLGLAAVAVWAVKRVN
ncbi:MAG: SdrD B-like domain-containing protein [Candidatus Promineifilaceae bacterium]